MDYVRVDFDDCYIYLANTVPAVAWDGSDEYRAKELLYQRPMWHYQRIKRMDVLSIDKKVNVWYNKIKG